MDLAGKVAIVTGAGAGLGRAEALELARGGAHVVLNDLPGALAAVAAEIEELGAKCAVVEGDVGERATADALLASAVEHFGGLHVLVNNAGVLRDRMLFNMSDEDWDLVMRVHLRGHFLLSRNAAAYWRQQSKDTGGPVYARVVNTSSEAFLLGPEGQPNYAAAKAGIAALTVSTARGLARYGVRANAICPRARTAMTAHVFGDAPSGSDPLDPVHVAKFVAYLASPAAESISGQVFVVHGGAVTLMAPPTVERRFDAVGEVGEYFAGRDPQRTFSCTETLNP
ncbi:3-oxoacyl-ACP reductase [Lentzea sp. NBRC 105346]|uniref:3-oxoacyl-ACP reductase n=1 Tax=Lentzea sp. NBRC 105346 TaxID=3032205 RepID=UPI0024A355EB|nr:3-oxoacyl-ACP reductase [Lentzea sp. NBRC 105346]GLZ31794.1 3-oxoacyl-ACP reductase [Lentzea sp. NBRC 105346]